MREGNQSDKIYGRHLTEVLLCWFRNRSASLRTGNENRWEKNLEPLGQSAQQPSTWCGRSEQILLHRLGCEARKASAGGEVFFLDFYLYRTAGPKCPATEYMVRPVRID